MSVDDSLTVPLVVDALVPVVTRVYPPIAVSTSVTSYSPYARFVNVFVHLPLESCVNPASFIVNLTSVADSLPSLSIYLPVVVFFTVNVNSDSNSSFVSVSPEKLFVIVSDAVVAWV